MMQTHEKPFRITGPLSEKTTCHEASHADFYDYFIETET